MAQANTSIIVCFTRRLRYIGRQRYCCPHEYLVERPASRFSRSDRCARLHGCGILLAIGIGANTAIFSILDGLLLHPLPYADAERLVILEQLSWPQHRGRLVFDRPILRHQKRSSRLRATRHRHRRELQPYWLRRTRTRWDHPSVVKSALVLGQHAALGRTFVPDEDGPGRNATAILSYGTWARRFGSDPRLLGKRSFSTACRMRSWVSCRARFPYLAKLCPRSTAPSRPRSCCRFRCQPARRRIATMKTTTSSASSSRVFPYSRLRPRWIPSPRSLRHQYPEVYPPNGGLTFSIVPLLEQVIGNVRHTLYLLLGAVGFVLLIACVNLANLQLSRGVARQKKWQCEVRLARPDCGSFASC